MKKLAGKSHPNIYEAVTLFKSERAATEVSLMQLAAGGLPRRRRRKYRNHKNRLKTIKEKHEAGGDNASSEGDNDIQTGSEKLQRKQKDNSTCKPQVKFTKRKNVTSTRKRKGEIRLEGEKVGEEENSEESEGERR